MLLRMIAVGLIWFGCSIAWLVLGGTVTSRTSEQQHGLGNAVGGLYGSELVQSAPQVTHPVEREHVEYVDFPGGQRETRRTMRTEHLPVQLAGQDVKVTLALDQRRKGLLWFATYQASFDGSWRVTAPAEVTRPMQARAAARSRRCGLRRAGGRGGREARAQRVLRRAGDGAARVEAR